MESWKNTYTVIGHRMQNLEELHVNLRVCEAPLMFSFHKYIGWKTRWVDDLCALAGLKKLKDVQVHLTSRLLDVVYTDQMIALSQDTPEQIRPQHCDLSGYKTAT